MSHAFKLGETEHPIELARRASGRYELGIDGATFAVAVIDGDGGDGAMRLSIGAAPAQAVLAASRGDEVFVHIDGVTHTLRYRHPLDRLADQAAGNAADFLVAPMPGSLVALNVAAGQEVRKGEALLVMESMKMETTLLAPRDGIIEQVYFEKGQTFDRDARLLSLVAGAAA